MNQTPDTNLTKLCNKAYANFLKSFFEKSRSVYLNEIILHWISNGIEKSKISKEYEGNDDSKKKKTQTLTVDRSMIVDKNRLEYSFFKKILLLKPDFYIVGSTIHLFNDNVFGIEMSKLNNEQLEIYRILYEKRDLIFKRKKYFFGQPILDEPNITLTKIPSIIKFNILISFHILFIKTLVRIISDGSTKNQIDKLNCIGLSKKKIHFLSTIKFLENYKTSLLKIKNEIIGMQINRSEVVEYCNILSIFIEKIESYIVTLK